MSKNYYYYFLLIMGDFFFQPGKASISLLSFQFFTFVTKITSSRFSTFCLLFIYFYSGRISFMAKNNISTYFDTFSSLLLVFLPLI